MKKTCGDCIALSEYPIKCELGYNIKVVTYEHIEINAIPKEMCPKPKTIKEYVRLYMMGRN